MANNTHSLSLVSASSQRASIADASCPNLEMTGSQTYMAWIKGTTFETTGNKINWIMGKSPVGLAAYRLIDVFNTNPRIQISGLSASVIANASLSTGRWYHVAFRYDATAGTLAVFINGILDKSVSVTGTPTDTNGDFAIGWGGAGSSTDYFNGQIDDVAVYNTALTDSEIQARIFKDKSSDSNLQGYWKLDNDYTDSSSNGYNLTASGSPTFSTTVPFPTYTLVSPVELGSTTLASDANLKSYWKLNGNFTDSSNSGYNLTSVGTPGDTSGKFNGGKSFVISTSYATITQVNGPNLNINNSAFSSSVWAKPTNTAGGWQYPLSKRSQSNTNSGYYLAFGGGTDIRLFIGNGTISASAIASTPVSNNNWYHIVGTYDGSTLRIYVNGILSGTASLSGSIGSVSDRDFFLALNSINSAEGFTGELDDVAIFNRVLTADEIFELYTGLDKASTAWTKDLSETVSIVDTVKNQVSKILSEVVSVVGSVITRGEKNISEITTVVSTLTKSISGRVFSQSLTIVDTVDEAQVLLKTLSEIITVIGSFARDITKSISQQVSIVDSFIRQMIRGLFEVIFVPDTILKVRNFIESFSESATITDIFSRIFTGTQSLTESITIATVFVGTKIFGFVGSGTITIVDSIINLFGKVFSEKVTVEETLEIFLNGVFGAWKKTSRTVGTWTKQARTHVASWNKVDKE